MTHKSKKLLVAVLSMVLLGTLGIFGQAQTSFVPLSISVAPGFGNTVTSPSFNVAVTVDKDPAAQGNSSYQQTEIMRITTRPDIASYIYLFNIRATGEIDAILPNNFEAAEYTGANQSRVFPTVNRGYEFRVAGAQGRSYIMAVATQTQLSAQQVQQIDAQVASSSTNASGLTVLNLNFPLISQAWAVTAMPFNVGNTNIVLPPPTVNQFGSLHIQTNIINGRVSINNQNVGSTNSQGSLELNNLPVGFHSIRIEAPAAGFLQYDNQFSIQANQQSHIIVAF